MDSHKIILFMCNWAPHTAFLDLQDEGADIPAGIKMVRIPCTGRISKSLLFKPFEMGADGVALVGCEPGACRYGSGTDIAQSNAEETREILELLGLGKERLQLSTFLPEDSEALLRFLRDFSAEIQAIGTSPVSPSKSKDATHDKTVREIVSSHDVYACQDCGKCTSACPLAQSGKPFSPRALAGAIIAEEMDSPTVDDGVWTCLTCGLCYDRCPSAVNYPVFIQDVRHFLRNRNKRGHESHGGFFQSLMRTMTSADLGIQKWENLPDGIQTDPESKVMFFGGCAPYFDTFFSRHLGVKTFDMVTDSLRLLNFFDITPALLQGERCCGHDLLWTGDQDNFRKLAALNREMISRLGVEEVITACPECYRTLLHDYPEQGIELPFKVTHMYDLLEQEIDKGAVDFKKTGQTITYQDSCRLSRLEGRPDLPRTLLGRLRPGSFKEMQDTAGSAICCGNTGWTGCDTFSKALQVKRLKQARDTGSDLLVTSCPKCQIHLRCAMEDPFMGDELRMEMMDLTSVIARAIHWE